MPRRKLIRTPEEQEEIKKRRREKQRYYHYQRKHRERGFTKTQTTQTNPFHKECLLVFVNTGSLKKSVTKDYTFEDKLEIKEEELSAEIKTEPVDENDAPMVEDPLTFATSPNILAENQREENCLHATNHYKQEKTDAVKLTKSVFKELWNGTSFVALPSKAWACHLIPSATTNRICFAKLDLVNGKPFLQRSIVIVEDNVQVFILDKPVENSILGPLLITSVVEFQSFLHAVDCLCEVGGVVVVSGDA